MCAHLLIATHNTPMSHTHTHTHTEREREKHEWKYLRHLKCSIFLPSFKFVRLSIWKLLHISFTSIMRPCDLDLFPVNSASSPHVAPSTDNISTEFYDRTTIHSQVIVYFVYERVQRYTTSRNVTA